MSVSGFEEGQFQFLLFQECFRHHESRLVFCDQRQLCSNNESVPFSLTSQTCLAIRTLQTFTLGIFQRQFCGSAFVYVCVQRFEPIRWLLFVSSFFRCPIHLGRKWCLLFFGERPPMAFMSLVFFCFRSFFLFRCPIHLGRNGVSPFFGEGPSVGHRIEGHP